MASWACPEGPPRALGIVLADFEFFGGMPEATSHIEPSSGILSPLGGHRGLSEALLEPSWTILDAPMGRGVPRSDPGEGVGGRVNPSLEQGMRNGFGRENTRVR